MFSKWKERKCFQNGHQGIFSKWKAWKYFRNGNQGNIFKMENKEISS